MLFRLVLLLGVLQWVLAAPTFPEPHFYNIDEAAAEAASKIVKPVPPTPFFRRFVTSSKGLLDGLLGAITGQPATPAAGTQFPTMSNTNSTTNSTGLMQLRIRAGLNGTFPMINGTSLLLANFTPTDPAVLEKRRMAIPKWNSPFANSKIVVETPRGRR